MNNTSDGKPNIGDVVKVTGEYTDDSIKFGRITQVWDFDQLDEWWDMPTGEDKVALLDALEQYGTEKAATAEWFASIVNVEDDREGICIASFECELM